MHPEPFKRILFVSANPKETTRLRLDEEARKIKEALQRSKYRDRIQLETCWATTPKDLRRSLLDQSPQIVHFCGHGEGEAGLVLEDEQGQKFCAGTEALSELFSLFADQIECVVLNACYSEVQAKAIVQHIPFVVGMNDAIGDLAAVGFAEAFYDAIGAGRSSDFAYKLGCIHLRMTNIKEADIPVLKTREKRTSVPQVWLEGWEPLPPEDDLLPDVVLDWKVNYCRNPRRFPTVERWEQVLAPQLVSLKAHLRELFSSSTIAFRSTFSLPAILAVGCMFPEAGQYRLQIQQNREIWRSDASTSQARFRVVQEQGKQGDHLLVGLSITGQGWADLERWLQTQEDCFDAIIYAEIDSEPGSRAIVSNGDANALACHAKDLLRQYQQQYGAKCIHLILFAPAGFALLLGHRLNRLGEVVAYEWDGATASYQASVKLLTG